MSLRLLLAATLLLTTPGCAWLEQMQREAAAREQARLDAENAYVRSYVGQPQEAVLGHYGPPTQVLDDGRGGKIWVFTTVNASVTPARDETTFDAQNHVRTTTHYPEQRVESKIQCMFWVKDGKIYNATYRED